MATRPKTTGVFAGLLTREGKVRLQRRIEKDSIIPGRTFEGDWELPGGRVKEKDLEKALTLEVLEKELIREVEEELGIIIRISQIPRIYRAVYEDPEKGICDWAFMIPIPPECWDETAKMKRKTIDMDPHELRELAYRPKGEQLLSGWGKRMCRMSLAAIFAVGTNSKHVNDARIMLTDIKPDWWETEYSPDVRKTLTQFRRELGL